jgi:uridine kinase
MSASLVTLDDYYLDGEDAQKFFNNQEIDWDNPITINWKKLHSDIKNLLKGHEVVVERFNYETTVHDESRTIKSADVLIIEGIFALTDEELNDLSDVKVFVHADSDIRLIRRIKRDKKIRYENFDQQEFMKSWIEQIKPSHDKFIAPTEKIADFIINTTKDKEHKKLTISFLLGLTREK